MKYCQSGLRLKASDHVESENALQNFLAVHLFGRDFTVQVYQRRWMVIGSLEASTGLLDKP